MSESGPINRPKKTLDRAGDFTEIISLGKNIYRATLDGKYWILKAATGKDTSSTILLRREYELSCNLNHPNILSSLFYLEETPVGPAIMMEYIEGSTLEEFIGKAPARLRRKLLYQILDAVGYIHKKGLLHNDIKPANILVSDIGNDIKIIDFGYSETDADYLNHKLGGTAGASAPEILSGDITVKSAATSDIYALGGIIHLLFPYGLSGIARKCHRNNPGRRYRDIDSLRNAIRRHFALPYILTVSVLVLALLAAALIPDKIRQSRELAKETEQIDKITEIREYLMELYSASADTLSNRTLVSSWKQAYPVRMNFTNAFLEYKNTITEPELLFACDTIYARLAASLGELSNEFIGE